MLFLPVRFHEEPESMRGRSGQLVKAYGYNPDVMTTSHA
tara:strand:- start:56 stop:172 length:117 start_codon:yes stop_codon:yes gene_type:complete